MIRYYFNKVKGILNKISGKVNVPFLVVIVGQACNLKCKNCGNLNPYMPENIRRYKVEDIITSLDLFCKNIHRIDLLQIQGGEPLIYTDLAKLIEYIGTQKKIKSVQIATNGLFIPKTDVLSTIKKYDIDVRISSYECSHEAAAKFKQKMDELGIRNRFYSFAYGDGEWLYMGGGTSRSIKSYHLSRMHLKDFTSAHIETA